MSNDAKTMRLNEKEIAEAERYLAQFEKDARSWRWARWFLLAMAIVLLLSLEYHRQLAKEAYDLNQTDGLLNGLTPNSEVLENFVDAKIGLLRAEFDHSLLMMWAMVFAGPLLGYVIARWRQERRNRLVARCARAVLSATCERSPYNKSLNTDAGDPGAG